MLFLLSSAVSINKGWFFFTWCKRFQERPPREAVTHQQSLKTCGEEMITRGSITTKKHLVDVFLKNTPGEGEETLRLKVEAVLAG